MRLVPVQFVWPSLLSMAPWQTRVSSLPRENLLLVDWASDHWMTLTLCLIALKSQVRMHHIVECLMLILTLDTLEAFSLFRGMSCYVFWLACIIYLQTLLWCFHWRISHWKKDSDLCHQRGIYQVDRDLAASVQAWPDLHTWQSSTCAGSLLISYQPLVVHFLRGFLSDMAAFTFPQVSMSHGIVTHVVPAKSGHASQHPYRPAGPRTWTFSCLRPSPPLRPSAAFLKDEVSRSPRSGRKILGGGSRRKPGEIKVTPHRFSVLHMVIWQSHSNYPNFIIIDVVLTIGCQL